jgi:hypothetical protein
VTILTGYLDGRELGFRKHVVESLGKVGNEAAESVPKLIDLLRDPTYDGRESVARALGKIRAQPHVTLAALVEATSEVDTQVRIEAALALSRFGHDAVKWLPHLEPALTNREIRWALLPILVLGDKEKADSVWREITELLPDREDSDAHELFRKVLEALTDLPAVARTAFPMLFEGLLFKNRPTRESIEILVEELNARGADVDALWAGILKRAEVNRFGMAVDHFLKNPHALAVQKVDVTALLDRELAKKELNPVIARGLMVLMPNTKDNADPTHYLKAFRSPSSGLFRMDVLFLAARGLIAIGPGALEAVLSHRIPDAGEDPTLMNPEEVIGNARYLLALVSRRIVGALPHREASAARKRMETHPNRYMRLLARPERHLISGTGDRIRKRSWNDGSIAVKRISMTIDFPKPLSFSALEYLPSKGQYLALTQNGELLFLDPTEEGLLRVAGYQDMSVIAHELYPWPIESQKRWTCLTTSKSGEYFAVGGTERSGGSEGNGKFTIILVFQHGNPTPLVSGRIPIADLEELQIHEDSKTIVALEYWHEVHWLRYTLEPTAGLKISSTKDGGFCCQVASRALPDDTLICQMMNDEIVKSIDALTGEIRWSTEVPPDYARWSLYRCAASERYWAVYGGEGIVLGRSKDGEILGYLPLADENEGEVTAAGDSRNNHRVLAFHPDGCEFVVAAWKSEGKPRLVRFVIKEADVPE